MSAPAPRVMRGYQQEAVDAVVGAWGTDTRRVAVVMATGLGKSTVIAALAVTAARMGLRVILLAHRGELLDQMSDTIAAVAPGEFTVGIVRAERDEHHEQIVAASFQTVARDARLEAVGDRDVILVDECHHLPSDTYRGVVEKLGGLHDKFLCGFTATMRRDDSRALGDLFDHVVIERGLLWAIEHGHLVRPRGKTVHIDGLALDSVGTVAGDFAQGELAEVMEAATESVVGAITGHAADRRPIVFAASVDAAGALAEGMRAAGMAAEHVVGSTPREERAGIYERFRSGETRALVTVQVLTEGADFPACDCVVIARPTRSQNLYTQMVGRGLRQHPGKADALVLDLTGTSHVMGLVALTDLFPRADMEHVGEQGEPVDPPEAPVARKRREGPLDLVDTDLLAAGKRADTLVWMTSPGGTAFTPGREWAGLLIEHGGAWLGGVVSVRGEFTGKWVIPAPADLGAAKDAVEEWLSENDTPSRTAASWRRRSIQPSEAQLRLAASLGIQNAGDMTKARLSDEITLRLVAPRVDRVARRIITTS